MDMLVCNSVYIIIWTKTAAMMISITSCCFEVEVLLFILCTFIKISSPTALLKHRVTVLLHNLKLIMNGFHFYRMFVTS